MLQAHWRSSVSTAGDPMDKLHRMHALKKFIDSRRRGVFSLSELCEALECSPNTARRLLYSYRDDFNAPLEYSREAKGWRLSAESIVVDQLPGAWFSPQQVYSLLCVRSFLRQLDPGLLQPGLDRLMADIDALLGARGKGSMDFDRLFNLARIGSRVTPKPVFEEVVRALFDGVRIRISYEGRMRHAGAVRSLPVCRSVSPLRMTWYRGNWYLDGWCHDVEALRRFAVERIQAITLSSEPARVVPHAQLVEEFDAGFGVFGGGCRGWAVLKFNAYRARWVADEEWHPNQFGQWCEDGSYVLHLPYGRIEELVGDVLKYGSDCVVIDPPELRQCLIEQAHALLAVYAAPPGGAAP